MIADEKRCTLVSRGFRCLLWKGHPGAHRCCLRAGMDEERKDIVGRTAERMACGVSLLAIPEDVEQYIGDITSRYRARHVSTTPDLENQVLVCFEPAR